MRVAEVGEVRQCHARLEQGRHAAFASAGRSEYHPEAYGDAKL